MRLLFIQGGTRLKKDSNSKYYTDGNLNNKVWERYKKYCDELLVALRIEEKLYDEQDAKKRFNEFDTKNIKIFEMMDLMRPRTRFLSKNKREKVNEVIKNAVLECDKAIIRSPHNYYTLMAIKYCKKYNKQYLIEVAGYAFDVYYRNGSILGKIMSFPYSILAKRAISESKYCIYVTSYSIQKKYPCQGKNIGCSDVEINCLNDNFLNRKLKKYKNMEGRKIILGTIGWVNLKLKGQQDIIKALYELKKEGNDNFEYQLVGLGNHEYLDKLIIKYDLSNNVKILGGKNHDEVFEWLQNIDIYVQPSYSEGLCRAIIEAMSMACPVIVSDAGGNPELANPKYIFKKGNIKQIKKILNNITITDMQEEAIRSFSEAKKYEKELLDKKREEFYNLFIDEDYKKE